MPTCSRCGGSCGPSQIKQYGWCYDCYREVGMTKWEGEP